MTDSEEFEEHKTIIEGFFTHATPRDVTIDDHRTYYRIGVEIDLEDTLKSTNLGKATSMEFVSSKVKNGKREHVFTISKEVFE